MNEIPFLDAERLLNKYGFTWHAQHVRECLDLLKQEGSKGCRMLNTLEWWGGSGSIADVHLYRNPSSLTGEQKQDNRDFNAALYLIYEEMKNAGFTNERAENWAYGFKYSWDSEI